MVSGESQIKAMLSVLYEVVEEGNKMAPTSSTIDTIAICATVEWLAATH